MKVWERPCFSARRLVIYSVYFFADANFVRTSGIMGAGGVVSFMIWGVRIGNRKENVATKSFGTLMVSWMGIMVIEGHLGVDARRNDFLIQWQETGVTLTVWTDIVVNWDHRNLILSH